MYALNCFYLMFCLLLYVISLEQHCSTLPDTNLSSGTNKVYQSLAHQLPRVADSTHGLEPSQEVLTGEQVLVRTDSTATVAYINRQGSLRSRRMSQLARHLLLRSPKHLRSLHAIHIPGFLNWVANELSQAALPGEWRLHPRRSS